MPVLFGGSDLAGALGRVLDVLPRSGLVRDLRGRHDVCQVERVDLRILLPSWTADSPFPTRTGPGYAVLAVLLCPEAPQAPFESALTITRSLCRRGSGDDALDALVDVGL